MNSRLINGMVAEYGLKWIGDTDKARLGIKVPGGVEYNVFMQERAKCQRSSDGTTDLVANGMAKIAAMYQSAEGRGKHLTTQYATELADKYLTQYNKQGLVGSPGEITEDDYKEVVAAFAITERLLYRVESERLQGITVTWFKKTASP